MNYDCRNWDMWTHYETNLLNLWSKLDTILILFCFDFNSEAEPLTVFLVIHRYVTYIITNYKYYLV
jgi:hypothetical protein